jgi:hypothetical protein
VYVDDLIFAGSSLEAIYDLIQTLSRHFPLKDLGALNFFLGISVTRVSAGLHLSQSKYVSDLPTCTKMSHAKPITSPMATNMSLSQFSGSNFSESHSTIVQLEHYCNDPDFVRLFVVLKKLDYLEEE